MASIGVQVITNSTPEGFTRIMRQDAERYGKLIRELNIKAE
jgi:hypothetical protein